MIVLPTKYIRKAYKDSLNGILHIYDSLPTATASIPYGVITSINLSPRPVKDLPEYTATVTLSIYDEFKENGGMLRIDNKTQEILNLLVNDKFNYIAIENFNHVICKMLDIFNDTVDVGAVTVYRNTLRIEHLVKSK